MGWGAAVAEIGKLVNTILGRRIAHNDRPETKAANRRAAIENEILNDDEAGANVRLNDDLFFLRMRRNAEASDNSSEPRSEEGEGGATIPKSD